MRNFILFIFISVISITIILFSWFSDGKILQSTNEEDLNIFNPRNVAEDSSTVWYPVGTGQKIPFAIQRYPTFLLLNFINNLGVPPFLNQAIFIGLIMVLGVTFMYLLLSYIFRFPWIYATFGAFFYLLNLYSMSSIWKRLFYSQYITWVYMPLFLLAWIKWIESGKIKWLMLLLMSSLIFSYTFAHPAFILTFWITAITFSVYKIWIDKKKTAKVLQVTLYSGIALFMWFVVNIWWAYPLLTTTSSYLETGAPSWQLNLSSLIGVSQYQDTKDIIFLRQSWIFGKDHEWYGFYKSPFVYLISITILIVVIVGLFKNSKSLHYRGFWVVLLILGWFISKGSNFPLGNTFYTLLFSLLPQTAVFRNPYEKFGNVFLITYTIFFALGIFWISKKFTLLSRGLFLGGSFLIFCGVLVYPIWNGSIFPPEHRLNVPSYYTEANNYLNLISSQRIFHLPFTLDDVLIKYSWGYMAEDPLPNLFNSDSVSRPNVPIFKNIYRKIPNLMEDNNFPKILGMLGVDNVILHKDSVSPEVNIASISAVINNWEGMGEEKQIGELLIYSLNKSLVKPLIFPADAVVKVGFLEEGLDLVLDNANLSNSVFTQELVEVEKIKVIPQINFNKFSNINYEVKIEKAENPFILVFNNTFDPNWQLKIGGMKVDKHFIVNGFANGWLVAKSGNYSAQINLKIWPWE